VTRTDRSQKRKLFRSCYSFTALLLVYFFPMGGLTGYWQSVSAPPSAPNSAAQSTIVVHTELVVLPVRVTDGSGTVVSGLTREQFRVYEDNRLQRITSFEEEDVPVTVGLVVDHSRSMGLKLAEVSAAVWAFAKSGNPQDEMFVVNFNDSVWLQLAGGKPFTSDAGEIEKGVGAVSTGGQTALYDGIVEGLHHLQLGRWSKKALLIISDGGDNASRHTYSDVLALARRSQAVIYSIGLVSELTAEANPGLLRRLCKDTGGIAFFPEAGKSVVDISTQIARDLREQYTIGFVPEKKNTGESFRKIQVKVSVPGRGGIRVRTRSGYLAAVDERSPAQPQKGSP